MDVDIVHFETCTLIARLQTVNHPLALASTHGSRLNLTRVCNICRGGAACVCTNVCTDVADAFAGRRTRRVRLDDASLVQRDVVSLRFVRRRVDSVGGGRDSTSSIAATAVVLAYEY